MLTHIHIRNFAIVDELELDFAKGMTVLTGETGAGKSILLDALGLALGDRADTAMIRHGAERAEISVTFDIRQQPDIAAWLKEQELDLEDDCIIRRTLSVDGKSRGFINGQPQTLQNLRELGEKLVDIHGQHAHQALLRRDMQCQTLDAYAHHQEILVELGRLHQHWQQLTRRLEQLERQKHEQDAKLELLRYQAQELDTLELAPGELAELDEQHQRLANGSKLLEGSAAALQLLQDNEEGAALMRVQQALRELEQLHHVDPALGPIVELLGSAQIQLQEAANELRRYHDRLDLDPAQLDTVEQRLADIHQLARKHRCPPEQLLELHARLGAELRDIEQSDITLDQLGKEIAATTAQYLKQAKKLSQSRQKAARELEKKVCENMQRLGMKGGRLEISMTALPDGELSATGLERVEFLISANPGQPVQPLSKVASGGELSRISLAIQVITSATHGIPTLIFDEVDVGIGGGTAEIVGHMLRQLGAHRQVLCVTHQPQVAALGHHHLHVHKHSDGKATVTSIESLTPPQRIDELARMLGGLEITTQTRAHAEEMLTRSQGGA